ncbi:FkbM family methyltransferase [Acidiferrimicrobium sp. IK]|uniref:FkbM family methyltransferase n=1 Tax=Acidiferrimicrobium sp. IK TaxID=2871700 RepID=UPI0021CB414C|nr:FkbM family methyltransferase [Acidiferrimicrobium sp. IK]
MRAFASLRAAAPTPEPSAATLPRSLTAGPYEKLTVDVGTLWVSAADEVMRDHLRNRGTWEPEEGRLLRRLLRPGSRFLDVGANIGYFSLLAAKAHPGIRVDAVEPFPPTCELLRMNLWLNGVDAAVWPVALDHRRTTLSIHAAEHNVGDARVADVTAGDSELVDIVVPAVPGDEIFAGRTFDVIKLDVQGWELEVLTGLRQTIRAAERLCVVAEFWPAALRERDVDPGERLVRYRELFGFRVLVSQGDDLEELTDSEILLRCDAAGPDGQVNLLLER